MTVDALGRVRIAIVRRMEPLPMPIDRRIEPVSERALFRGYSRGAPVRVQPCLCVCGGIIDPGYETEIQAAVARHQATPRHLAWRQRSGF